MTTFKNLKLRLSKTNSSSNNEGNKSFEAELTKQISVDDTRSMDVSEKTEDTVSEHEEEEEEEEALYGYEETSPRSRRRASSSVPPPPSTPTKTPRRSSLKSSNNNGSSPRKEHRRHSLTFSRDVVVATITPTPDLATKKSLWFEEKDYEKMRKKIHAIAQRAQEGDGHKYCTRGLESLIRQDSETRRYKAWDAVLDEQEHQVASGLAHYDEDALSQSYRSACEESIAEASIRALQDQKDVEEYLKETRQNCRRSSM